MGACIIGLAPVLVRLSDAGPAATGFWRLAFSLPIVFVLTSRDPEGAGVPSRAAALAGLVFALDLGFWHYGIENTSVGKATILSNLTPIVVTGVAWLVLGQRPRRLFLLAVALAVAGASIMTLAKGLGSVGPNPMFGDLLSIATAFWYSMYFFAIGAARRRDGALRVMLWTSATGASLLLAGSYFLGERLLPVTRGGWIACVSLGLMHVAGQGSITWALGRLPPATASVTVLVQPIVATILGRWLFNELISAAQMTGAGVALAGVVLAQWSSRPGPRDD